MNEQSQLQLAPPPITEDDARKGILSLIERGLIPPAAQLTLDPSPVKNRIMLLHDPEDRNKPPCTPGDQNSSWSFSQRFSHMLLVVLVL